MYFCSDWTACMHVNRINRESLPRNHPQRRTTHNTRGKKMKHSLAQDCDLFKVRLYLQGEAGEKAKANWPPDCCATQRAVRARSPCGCANESPCRPASGRAHVRSLQHAVRWLVRYSASSSRPPAETLRSRREWWEHGCRSHASGEGIPKLQITDLRFTSFLFFLKRLSLGSVRVRAKCDESFSCFDGTSWHPQQHLWNEGVFFYYYCFYSYIIYIQYIYTRQKQFL